MTKAERRQFVLLLFITVCMALFEVAGVALIMPLLSLMNDPSMIQSDPIVGTFAKLTGLTNARDITLTFGSFVLVMLLAGMVVRGVGTYAQTRFCIMRAYGLSLRLLGMILSQPYAWFLSRNTAEFGQSLLSEIDQVVRRTFLPAVLLVSNVTVVGLITITLFLANPTVAFGATGLLMIVYLGVYSSLRNKLHDMGEARLRHNKDRFQVVSEIGQSVKEIKLMGLEDFSVSRFDNPALGVAESQSFAAILTRLPRFAIEGAIYGGFVLMVLLMVVFSGQDLSQLLPLFGLIGVASMKLFPALQQIYGNLAYIRFSSPAFAALCETERTLSCCARHDDGAKLIVQKQIAFSEVRYRYDGADKDALCGLSLNIPAGHSVGFVGGTGAGKTTLIDILLGLLQPCEGEVQVDETLLTDDSMASWQRSVGYVPQSIFLSDDTIAANIAFGDSSPEIDMTRVIAAAKAAQLHDFITSELPEGYQTKTGERGSRLSGGQRQRIGIARALYRKPAVLVLDEATSALDNITERAVINAIQSLQGMTVIMIAHRLGTLRECDTIFMLEQGSLAASGCYADLMAQNTAFQKLAGQTAAHP